MCLHGDAGRSSDGAARIDELHEYSVRRWLEWHVTATCNEDGKGRRRVGIDRRRDTRHRRREALA